jgi:hypothetical protein
VTTGGGVSIPVTALGIPAKLGVDPDYATGCQADLGELSSQVERRSRSRQRVNLAIGNRQALDGLSAGRLRQDD